MESGAATGIKFDDPLHAESVMDASEGNKIDLESKINKRDIYNFCDKYKVDYLGVSVKKNIRGIIVNINKGIHHLLVAV